jgi:hypothetical protein
MKFFACASVNCWTHFIAFFPFQRVAWPKTDGNAGLCSQGKNIVCYTSDQANNFLDREEYKQNIAHERAMYSTATFLTHVQSRDGIWYDDGNHGFIARRSEQPPSGCKSLNGGIQAFLAFSKRIGEETKLVVNESFYYALQSLNYAVN